jgi:hypothetical protein
VIVANSAELCCSVHICEFAAEKSEKHIPSTSGERVKQFDRCSLRAQLGRRRAQY